MTKWEILTEKRKTEILKKTKSGKQKIIVKEIEVELPEQIDDVGNIYQRGGGVIPNACQKCGEPFESETKQIPIEEEVPSYSCNECDFNNGGADLAWDHEKANKGHKIEKVRKKRLVGFNTIIVGKIPRVTKTKDDCIIVCDYCLEH